MVELRQSSHESSNSATILESSLHRQIIIGFIQASPTTSLLKLDVESKVVEYITIDASLMLQTILQYLRCQSLDLYVNLMKNSDLYNELASLRNDNSQLHLTILPDSVFEDSTSSQETRQHVEIPNVEDRMMNALHYVLAEIGLSVEEFKISSVVSASRSFLEISREDMEILGIFEAQAHPNKLQERSREGFSLYGLLNTTVTIAGKITFKRWFMHPLLDIAELNRRYDAVSELIAIPCETFATMEKLMRLFTSPPWICSHIEKYKKPTDLMNLVASISTFCKIRSLISPASTLLQDSDMELSSLVTLCQRIKDTINFEESKNLGKFCLNYGVSSELDRLQELYINLPEFLSGIAGEIYKNENIGMIINNGINVVYFPQLGFLTVLPNEPSVLAFIQSRSSSWTLVFKSDNSLYLKNSRMEKIDEEIGDIYGEITDLEIEFVNALLSDLLQHAEDIRKITKYVGILDCIMAYARVSRSLNLSRPTLSLTPAINVKNSRHLLQERATEVFIPNNIEMKSGICIVSGANYSGKSVYLKQVGLLVFMAQIGCYIPGDSGAVIGIVDKIFVRMQATNYNTFGTSTFFTDLNQVVRSLSNATKNSLLLIDEFGKGTDISVGLSMFSGLIETLLVRGQSEQSSPDVESVALTEAGDTKCPRTILVTHFIAELLIFGMIPEGLVTWKQMSILTDDKINVQSERSSLQKRSAKKDESTSNTSLTVTFMYKIQDGICRSSWGINCARIAGIDEEIIDRAAEIAAGYNPFLPVKISMNQRKDTDCNVTEMQEKIHHFLSFQENLQGLNNLKKEFGF